ncbi:TetR/AcrR family transcriptional regulator [Endothiovibrio diazotrophicus]
MRERLLKAARTTFLRDDYDRVTIRRIAEEAESNSAMIHYYFGSKEGLYKAMVADVIEPFFLRVEALGRTEKPEGFGELFDLHSRVMAENPEFPPLVVKTLGLGAGPARDYMMELLPGRLRALFVRMIDRQKALGQVATDIDPTMLGFSFMSLAAMPFVMHPAIEEMFGGPLKGELLERFIAHNTLLFEHGCRPSSSV